MAKDARQLKQTASQTAGPFVHIGLCPSVAGLEKFPHELGKDIAGPNGKGERIRVEGVVLDGTETPLGDVMIEIWQANADGYYAHPDGGGSVEEGFCGWGRVAADFDTGEWGFDTVKPGSGGVGQAPHLNLWIVARGINIGLNTRLYFEDETDANAKDTVLNQIDPAERRGTLVAAHSRRSGVSVYRFEIRLQGKDETVFFDV